MILSMWQDVRNREICEKLQAHNPEVYSKCGATVNTVFTAPKITWLRQNRPHLYEKAFKAMVVPDYLIWFMTGAFVTDRTYGSRTLLMNLSSMEWDESLCRLFDVDSEKLCSLIDQGSVAGIVTPAFHALTGISIGTPVISAGGDQQCGALGLGVLDNHTAMINSGTGSFILTLTDQPVLDNPAMICNVSAIPGKFTVESNVLASASALNWLVRQFFPEYWGDSPDLDSFNRLIAQVPPGANGVYCLPHFQGCGTRDWNPDARAAFCGISLHNSREDLARALYEGLAAEIAKSMAVLPACCRDAQMVYFSGGLSKSDLFTTILSCMLRRPLIRYCNPQSTAIGAFASAAVTLGIFSDYAQAVHAVRSHDTQQRCQPDKDLALFYDGYCRQSEQLYRALSDIKNKAL